MSVGFKGDGQLTEKRQASPTAATEIARSQRSADEPEIGDSIALEKRVAALQAERDALQEELIRGRHQAADHLHHLQSELDTAELDRERLQTELEALQEVQTERDRLQTWIWEIEQELCAAQGRVGELERRIEGLSQLNARLSLEKAGLQARLDSVGGAGGFGQESGQPVDAAMQRRLSELEEKISRVTMENALHAESAAELENLRVQLRSAARMREELRHDLVQALEKAAAAEEAAADIITERDMLREVLGERQPGVRVEKIGDRERAGAGSARIEELRSELVRLKEELQSARDQAPEGRNELLAELKRTRDVRDKLAIELGRTQRELEKSTDAAVQAGAARDRLRATLEGVEAQRAEPEKQAREESPESGLAPPGMTGARREAEYEDWRLGRQLREIKRLYDEGRIDREEVERRRQELLDES